MNPNPSNQAQEVIFCRERQNQNHDSIYFNHNLLQQVPSRYQIKCSETY